MFDIQDPRQAYEIFRLQWMINHGYSIRDLITNLESLIEEQNESGERTGIQDIFNLWQFNVGFGGAIWPCYQEFLDYEYTMMLKENQ